MSAAELRSGTNGVAAMGLIRAVVSPDSRLLAGSYRESPSGGFSLGVIDVATGKPVTVFPNFAQATGSGGMAFTLDGKALLYTTTERVNIWTRPLAGGGEPKKVTNFSDLDIARFALSPDGKTFALCRGAAIRDAVLITNFR